jgi:CubicO group peptidase (beta-lactamase class C family)
VTRPTAPERVGEAELREAVDATDAPDVVFACSQQGRRTVVTGGTAPPPGAPGRPGPSREALRYELGSASKTFTGLLLAELAHRDQLGLGDPVAVYLPRDTTPHRNRDAVTLRNLITHTAGLPRLPWDLYPRALPHWRTNPYADYPADRLVAAFARSRPRRPPGARWRYSNFGVALLGPALSHAMAMPFPRLLAHRVLTPLGLDATGLVALGPGIDATGHGLDGATPVPPFSAGAFTAAGGVRATPGDLLRYLEAHLRPGSTPLGAALAAVQEPQLRRGYRRRQVHTLTWFRHAVDGGHVYFHSGATMGQEAFLGFRPDTGTALVALATRRHRRGTTLVHAAYRLLTGGSQGLERRPM